MIAVEKVVGLNSTSPTDILILATATVPRIYNGLLLVLALTSVAVVSYPTDGCV